MTRQRPKCQVCGNGILVAMFGRQWVHWSHLLDLDHKAVPPEPSQREAQDKEWGAGSQPDRATARAGESAPVQGPVAAHPGDVPTPYFVPPTPRQFDTIEADYERIWRRYA